MQSTSSAAIAPDANGEMLHVGDRVSYTFPEGSFYNGDIGKTFAGTLYHDANKLQFMIRLDGTSHGPWRLDAELCSRLTKL